MIELPRVNADGLPPVPLTDEQRYFFDVRGWMLIPAVLSEDEVATMREHCYRLQREPESIPLAERSPIGGPLQKLIDHPVVVGFMNEFVAHGPLATENGYGFRLEGTFMTIRKPGFDNYSPHGGSGLFNYPGNSHTYHCRPGSANSGLTRVVWELNPVQKGDGGTLFLSGSHKAAFPLPPVVRENRHAPEWDDYECPAGSCLIFTEAITHTGTAWINPDVDRVSLFHCYNTVGQKWHSWEPHPELFEALAPLRKTLVRPVYCQDNAVAG